MVLHETTVYPIMVVLRHVNLNSSCKFKVKPDTIGTVWQYFLAVFVSCVLVRLVVPAPKYPPTHRQQLMLASY